VYNRYRISRLSVWAPHRGHVFTGSLQSPLARSQSAGVDQTWHFSHSICGGTEHMFPFG
jgi:hypothetical protein